MSFWTPSNIVGRHISLWPLVLAMLMSTAGCHVSPTLSDYPRREIDRDHVLPEGVISWKTPTFIEVEEQGDGTTQTIGPVPLPLFFDVGLTRKVTLHAALIFPTGLSVHLFGNSRQIITMDIGLGGLSAAVLPFGRNDVDGAVFAQGLGVRHRYRLHHDLALESSARASYTYRQKTPDTRALSVQTGPLWQISNSVYLRSWVRIAGGQVANEKDVDVPIGIGGGWNFHCRWNVSASAEASILAEQFSSFVGIIQLAHLW